MTPTPSTRKWGSASPVSLLDVYHQPHAQRVLQHALQGTRVPHAYLFHGPDGVGKELLARGLGQTLLCGEAREVALEPACAQAVGLERAVAGCGACTDCQALAHDSHPDLHLIHRYLYRDHPDSAVRQRKGLELGIDVLRHFVIERVAMKPARGWAKLFIVREADRITTAAQNALLKTLEEPPSGTFIILVARSLDRLLPTTRSRCQPVRFDALPLPFVAERLRAAHADLSAADAEWYAALSGGSVGRALAYVEQELLAVNGRLVPGLAALAGDPLAVDPKAWTDEAKALAEHHRTRDPDITDTEANRQGLKSLFHLASAFYSDVLKTAVGAEGGIVNTAAGDQLRRVAERMTPADAARRVQRLAQAEQQLDLNANVQLCVECLLHALGTAEPAGR